MLSGLTAWVEDQLPFSISGADDDLCRLTGKQNGLDVTQAVARDSVALRITDGRDKMRAYQYWAECMSRSHRTRHSRNLVPSWCSSRAFRLRSSSALCCHRFG